MYYYLLLLKDGQYIIHHKENDLNKLKQYRKYYWQNVKYRIIQSVDSNIQRELDKLNKPIKHKERKLSKFKARDVAEAILCDNAYQHCAMFKNKQDAITNINNFTSTTLHFTFYNYNGIHTNSHIVRFARDRPR